ncbi:MAG: peptidylprolyl isomerase [Clostridia bacterium]|nr:peptidylprolyl isomerase [Clostridia bacterium]MBR6787145.1 peptidylprolyl isomerase [Clostridia bacterium]
MSEFFHPAFTITMKDGSVMTGELYPEYAPQSVGNFISLANSGFYDGLIFHRVIPDFMIQGGDPQGTGMGGPGYSIVGEFARNGVNNPLKHTPGVLSMARSMRPNSAGSQFFIMTSVSPHLDGSYAAFGRVLTGLEHADRIQNVKRNRQDKPLEDQVIASIRVDAQGREYPFERL